MTKTQTATVTWIYNELTKNIDPEHVIKQFLVTELSAYIIIDIIVGYDCDYIDGEFNWELYDQRRFYNLYVGKRGSIKYNDGTGNLCKYNKNDNITTTSYMYWQYKGK